MPELVCVYNNQYPCPPWWTPDWIEKMQNLHTGLKISQIDAAVEPKIYSEYKGLRTDLKAFPAYLLYNEEPSQTPLANIQGNFSQQSVENFVSSGFYP